MSRTSLHGCHIFDPGKFFTSFFFFLVTYWLPCHNIRKPLLGANKAPAEKHQAEVKV